MLTAILPAGTGVRSGAPIQLFHPQRDLGAVPPAKTGRGGFGFKSVPVGEDVPGLRHLLRRTREIESEFSGSTRDLDLDAVQAALLHSQVELFMSFFDPVPLKAIRHDGASTGELHKAMTKG